MSDDAFQRYSAYYDLLYRDKDYAAEANYVAHTLRSASPGIETVLELGSGTGRHGRLLAGQGFSVFGIEGSESMVAAAQRMAIEYSGGARGSFDCIHGDIRKVAMRRTFDAVISLFHVMSYQISNRDVRSAFDSAGRHLDSGGLFFFDVWHGPAVLHERPAVRVKRTEDESTRVTRIAEPTLDVNANTVTVRYTVLAEAKGTGLLTSFGEIHHIRYFFPTEISMLAEQAGFEVVRNEEFLSSAPASEGSWSVAYLLRRQS